MPSKGGFAEVRGSLGVRLVRVRRHEQKLSERPWAMCCVPIGWAVATSVSSCEVNGSQHITPLGIQSYLLRKYLNPPGTQPSPTFSEGTTGSATYHLWATRGVTATRPDRPIARRLSAVAPVGEAQATHASRRAVRPADEVLIRKPVTRLDASASIRWFSRKTWTHGAFQLESIGDGW